MIREITELSENDFVSHISFITKERKKIWIICQSDLLHYCFSAYIRRTRVRFCYNFLSENKTSNYKTESVYKRKKEIIKTLKLVLFKCNKILAEVFIRRKLRRKRGRQSHKWRVGKFMSRVGTNLSNGRVCECIAF